MLIYIYNSLLHMEENNMMNEIATNNGNWKIYGIYFIQTDATYGILKEAIETGSLQQSHLQQVTGWRNPIIVDESKKEIYFY